MSCLRLSVSLSAEKSIFCKYFFLPFLTLPCMWNPAYLWRRMVKIGGQLSLRKVHHIKGYRSCYAHFGYNTSSALTMV